MDPAVKKALVNGDGVTSITCTNMPDGLFDANNAKRHFSKFGKVTKIILRPKKQMCIIEYETPVSAKKALLNAGAYDGFMFDVNRTKNKVRRNSKKDDDPDWLPSADVEEELTAMGKTPIYRMSRQKPMEIEVPIMRPAERRRPIKKLPRKEIVNEKIVVPKPTSGTESPVLALSCSTTAEAALELHQLRFKVALTPDEQWRLLDARDRILRSWGGAGARKSNGGATIGTCHDMCPEKERLHRQAEHQVMSLEADESCDYKLVHEHAVKQYSRSSADQEMPMCYELRPPSTLKMTCVYLLHEIADTDQVSLADWFHFMWDRLRSIRKDITQQALSCAETISLVEMCARFHAHCAARLADLEHTQFDQKLNTDNLTKCLQTLKHMYSDVEPHEKPKEAEFRGYIALLNLGDSNFWWEIKELPTEIQKSKDILFAIEIFNAIDNNNYVRFFRLVRQKATYLQACILLRYFNDVRARALARLVKAFAPRGGSKYPARDIMQCLAFETVDSMKSFINHYGLRLAKTDDTIVSIILDRNQFIEDSDPYPLSRSIDLIESKRHCSIGEVLAGGQLPPREYENHKLCSSFNSNGTLTETALIAEDQGYTINDSKKDITSLKAELQRLSQSGRNIYTDKEKRATHTHKQEAKPQHVRSKPNLVSGPPSPTEFVFSPAELLDTVAPVDLIEESTISKEVFSFSKPHIVKLSSTQPTINEKSEFDSNLFTKPHDNEITKKANIFNKANAESSADLFAKASEKSSSNLFSNSLKNSVFNHVNDTNHVFSNTTDAKSVFSSNKDNLFSKHAEGSENIFRKAAENSNLFSNTSKMHGPNIFSSSQTKESTLKGSSVFGQNITNGPVISSNLFNNVSSMHNNKPFTTLQSKNTPDNVPDFPVNNNQDYIQEEELLKAEEHRIKEQERLQELENERKQREELKRKESERLQALKIEQEKRAAEERKRLEELRKIEEKRKEELKRQEERKKRAEEEIRFKERVDKESTEVSEELIDEVNSDTVAELLKEELDSFKQLLDYAHLVNEEIMADLCHSICKSEMIAEMHLTNKLLRKWFYIWKYKSFRNSRRRQLLEDTPVWLPDKPFEQEACCLKRRDEELILNNLKSAQKGHSFSAKYKPQPIPEPYKIVDIIRSSFLTRMRQIKYPYGKCFFWKITIVSPGARKWIHKKLQIEPWIIAAFSDKKKRDSSYGLIHIDKCSWNGLMDFAISVTLSNNENKSNSTVGLEGSNALLFYMSDDDNDLKHKIECTLRQKCPYQRLPLAVILPNDPDIYKSINKMLTACVNNNRISCFKLFTLDEHNIFESVNKVTRSALKWLAKRCPPNPPLEMDLLKSLCERYLANELWHRLKLERHTGISTIFKDLHRLVRFYNTVLSKLTNLLTNEDLYNYSLFPLEFKQYLDESSPYPRPYEFISSNVHNSENAAAIKELMCQLRLPEPMSEYVSTDFTSMEEQIRDYCGVIGWIEDPDEIVCKVVAIVPECDESLNSSYEKFAEQFKNFDLLNLLNIVVYEKINRLENFNNRCAIYDIASMREYRDTKWWYNCSSVKSLKHKIEDTGPTEIDSFIEAKRLKLSEESIDQISFERNDTLLETTIQVVEENINQYKCCDAAVRQLEMKLEEETMKALQLENMLKAALENS